LKKTDILLLLTDLSEKKGDAKAANYILDLYKQKDIPKEIIKYLKDNIDLDVINFYEHLRNSHNQKRSSLYKNIVKEVTVTEEVLITLCSYILQVNIFARKVEDKERFFSNCLIQDTTDILSNYYKTYNIEACIDMLVRIRANIKLFE